MKIAGMVLASVLLCVVVFALVAKRSNAKGEAESYCLNLIMPVAGETPFNPQELVMAFREMWGTDIVCAQPTGEGLGEWPAGQYMVGDGVDKNNLSLTWTPEPLKKEIVELLMKSSEVSFYNGERLSDPELKKLKSHKSYFQIEYVHGELSPKERVAFTAKLLLTLSKKYSASGIVNASAHSYTPSARIASALSRSNKLASADLFTVFVNVQTIAEGKGSEVHTHGMDQFGLPDIKMLCSSKDNVSYCYKIVSNAAVYMIDTGITVNVGDTGEFAGNSKIFNVTEVAKEEEHPFGLYGVIGLEPQ